MLARFRPLALAFLLLPAAAALAEPTRTAAPAEMPEPAAFALFVLGVGVLGASVRRRRAG